MRFVLVDAFAYLIQGALAMEFNTPEEVRAAMARAAADDYHRHIEYGHDLNPFCTQGARADWQRGFDGRGPEKWSGITGDFDTIYQRGKAAAEIVAREKEKRKPSCEPAKRS